VPDETNYGVPERHIIYISQRISTIFLGCLKIHEE
jgi:hypothetical protein